MAGWNFRKRKNILPGVTLNFSKNGITTSVGPKGARLSFGKKGTYLNTSIPGTGLYKRQKIGGSVKTDSNIESSGNKGCLRTIVWLVLIFSIISFFACILTFNDSKEQEEAQTEIIKETPPGEISDDVASIIAIVFLGAVSICCIVILVLIKKSSNRIKSNNGAYHEIRPSIKKYNLELKGYDPLFEDAARIIVINQQGSTSLIQRKFSIGYSRAGEIMDKLEAVGIVGPFVGSSAREVLIPDEISLERLLESLSDGDNTNS